MKYHLIKNFIIASATANMYWGWIVDGTTVFQKVIATVSMFGLMFMLLCNADKRYVKRRKQKRAEMTKSA